LLPGQGGEITCPAALFSTFYLSQRPYLVSGSLRDQVPTLDSLSDFMLIDEPIEGSSEAASTFHDFATFRHACGCTAKSQAALPFQRQLKEYECACESAVQSRLQCPA
jgi:hypothetical protein